MESLNHQGLGNGFVFLDTIGVKIPAGYNVAWSGQYEYMQRPKERLRLVVPMTLVIIFIIIYLSTKSFLETAIVLLAVPFWLVGVFWLMWWLDYNLSIAVWVGIIALAGVSAETGVVMLLYLDVSYKDAVKQRRMRHRKDLVEAIYHGAVSPDRRRACSCLAAANANSAATRVTLQPLMRNELPAILAMTAL